MRGEEIYLGDAVAMVLEGIASGGVIDDLEELALLLMPAEGEA